MSFGARWIGWSAKPKETRSNEERFWDQVSKDASGCWLWQGAKDKDGYGAFNEQLPNGKWKVRKSHRWSLAKKLGGVLRGQANHECDVRNCVNPDHLYPGTQKENMRDARVRNRIGTPARTRARAALMRDAGWTQREVAEEFGVGQSTVSKWEK